MKKLSLLFAMLTMMVSGAWAESYDLSKINFAFTNTNNTWSGVTVTITDNAGKAITEASASLSFGRSEAVKASVNDLKDNMVCPNVNTCDATTKTATSDYTITLTVTGLPQCAIKNVAITNYAVQSGGGYHEAGAVFDATYTVTTNEKQISTTGLNINAGAASTKGEPTTQTFNYTTVPVIGEDGKLTVSFNITRTLSSSSIMPGCYFALSQIALTTGNDYLQSSLLSDASNLKAGDIVLLNAYNGGNGGVYAYAADSKLEHNANGSAYWTTATSEDKWYSEDMNKYLWKLEDAGTVSGKQEWYLRNIATGLYVGSQQTYNTEIPEGTTRVPYYVEEGACTSTSSGNYKFTFTSRENQGTGDNVSLTSFNNGAPGVVVYKHDGANSQWAIDVVSLGENNKTTYTLKIGGKDGASVWFDGASYTASTQSVDYYGTYNDCVLVPTEYDGYTTRITKTDNTITVLYIPSTITRTTAKDSYGTICLPYDATATGATILACKGKNSDKKIVFEYATGTTDAESNKLTAGVPYLYRATAANPTFTITGSDYAEATTTGGAFQGSYTEEQLGTDGPCILSQNKFYTVANDNELESTNIFVGAYRAYVTDWEDLTVINNTPARAFTFSLVGGETTGINGIVDATVAQKNGKFINNGRMVIVNNGKKFNLAGQIVK